MIEVVYLIFPGIPVANLRVASIWRGGGRPDRRLPSNPLPAALRLRRRLGLPPLVRLVGVLDYARPREEDVR